MEGRSWWATVVRFGCATEPGHSDTAKGRHPTSPCREIFLTIFRLTQPSSVRRAPRRRRVPSIEVRAAERRIDGVHRDRGTKRCRRARTWAGYPCPAQTSCASIAKAPETNRWLKRPRVTCAETNASISRPCSMKVRRARRALDLETSLELCKGLSRDVIGVPSPVCWWIGLRARSCPPAGRACRGGCGAKPQPTSGRRRGRACRDDESRLRKPGF